MALTFLIIITLLAVWLVLVDSPDHLDLPLGDGCHPQHRPAGHGGGTDEPLGLPHPGPLACTR